MEKSPNSEPEMNSELNEGQEREERRRILFARLNELVRKKKGTKGEERKGLEVKIEKIEEELREL